MTPREMLEISDRSLAEFYRMTTRNAGGEIYEWNGLMLYAARSASSSPTVNGALRLNPALPPREALHRAGIFFGQRRHGYTLTVRAGDRQMENEAIRAGLALSRDEPILALTERPGPAPAPDGLAVQQVTDPASLLDFRATAVAGLADDDPEREAVKAIFPRPDSLAGPDRAGLVGYVGGRAAACAMTTVNYGAALIRWVSTLPAYRRQGFGSALALAAVHTGFDRGARLAMLESPSTGLTLFRRMGFAEIGRYREYAGPAPPT